MVEYERDVVDVVVKKPRKFVYEKKEEDFPQNDDDKNMQNYRWNVLNYHFIIIINISAVNIFQ